MPCNYLFRLDSEEKYEHLVYNTCNSSKAVSMCVGFFKKKYPKITPSNFEEHKKDICTFIWTKGIEGVALVEEKFEIYLGEVRLLKDTSLPPTPENFFKGIGLVARSVEMKPLKLLDMFKEDVA